MASDKVEKAVNLDKCDTIKGDPGRNWIAPSKPIPATPTTESPASQSSGNANNSGDNSTSESDHD